MSDVPSEDQLRASPQMITITTLKVEKEEVRPSAHTTTLSVRDDRFVYVCMRMCMRVYVCVCVCLCVYVYMLVCIFVFVCMCVCLCVCFCVCVYVRECMCV